MPPTPSSPPPNLAAKFAGTCGSCGKRYDVGERIAKDDTTGKWAHAWCLHGDLFRAGSAAPGAVDGTRCAATTKAGKPCANAPQKGERYCGPHLDMATRTPSPSPAPSPAPHETVAERAEREGWEPF